MDKIFQKLKLQLLIIFILPAIGLVFFSSHHVYYHYQNYKKSISLEKSVKYSQIVMSLVQSLQRERGLSLACLEEHSFCQLLKKERANTDKNLNLYYDFISNRKDGYKRLVENLQKISIIRKEIDSKKVSLLEVLDRYSAIIESLLNSVDIMSQKFIDEYVFKVILVFNKILELSEINGQERALIASVLEEESPKRDITDRLLMLDAREKGVRKIIEETIPTDILILCRKIIPLDYDNSFYELKSKIIHKRDFFVLTKKEWWKRSTQYIDKLFEVDKQIAKKLLEFKKIFKQKALNALYLSIGLWIVSFVALVIFMLLFKYFLGLYERYLNQVEFEKRLAQIFSEFSENLLFIETKNALISSFSSALSHLEIFDFHYIIDCKNKSVVITENISTAFIDTYEPKKLKKYIQEIQKKPQSKIIKLVDEEFKKSDTLFLLPIEHKGCLYLVVFGLKKGVHLDTRILDFINKVAELFLYAYRQLELKEEEKRLRDELRLLSYAFNTHEAITITDANARILKVNKSFERITGYKEEEVLGKTPAILKSGKHSKEFYQQMWDKIKKDGFWKGEIFNKRKDGTIYPEMLAITAIKDENGEITNYIAHFFDISDIKKAQQEIERRANYDILTDLLNRRRLIEELNIIRTNALKENFFNAFFFIDLDNFKYINDSYGHAIGDRVLIEIARRIEKLKKEEDIVARIAGDEFAFIAVDIAKDEQEAMKRAAIIAEKLINLVKEPVKVDDLEIEVSFSVGVAIFPGSEKSAEEVITNADIAMYHSKKRGKNTFSFYNEKLDIESKRFLIMKNEIKEGLKNGEFELYYQPKFEVDGLKLVGFEALLRWNSSSYGLMFPDRFLKYVYGNSLIYDITDFVVNEVKNTIKEWGERGYFPTISINLSAEQFNNKKYMEEFLKRFDKEWGKQVIIEILEDALVKEDINYTIDIINRFRQKGVRFAIDDFGSGYSSLSYLKILPVYELKIDKHFVINLFKDNNDKIVEMVVDIGHSFGFKVTAEGVESKEHMEFLQNIKCDFMQGFYMSRAVPKKDAQRFLC